jgi:hypothetical protein
MKHASSTALAAGLLALVGCGPHPDTLGPYTPETGQQRLIGEQCFWEKTQTTSGVPLTKIIHELRTTDHGDFVDLVIIFNRDFVDLSYGANSIGWANSKKGGHKFGDLRGSDHTEVALLDSAGAVRLQAKIDLISDSQDAPSEYASLGVVGGDGKMIEGTDDHVLAHGSSLDDNLNHFGYVLLEDSPETDANYTPNASFPDWNFFVEYRLTVSAEAFGAAGFGGARMEMVHASPSKFSSNTVEVEEHDCPPTGSGDDPFPDCLKMSADDGCLDPGNENDPNGFNPTGDPDAPTSSEPDRPTADPDTPTESEPGDGSGDPKDPGGSGQACSFSSDCGAAEYCTEAGFCVPDL